MKIKLPIHMRDYREVVDAELLLDIAPELADIATFAIHRAGRTENSYYKKKWFVANVETGAQLGVGDSKKEAIKAAKAVLDASTRERLLNGMDQVEAMNVSAWL